MTQIQTATAVYTVKSGDNLFDIGKRLGIPHQQIAELNHLPDPDHIEVGQKLKLPGHDFRSLTVKTGDTLSGISERLSKNVHKPADKQKLTVDELARINHIVNKNLIKVGETIVFANVSGISENP